MMHRDVHSGREDPHPRVLPDAVAFAHTIEDVSRLLALCDAHGVPVVPFGAGTSLEGHVTPVRGGIEFSFAGMNDILAVHAPTMDCRAQTGETRQALNAHLRDAGLFFPLDPGTPRRIADCLRKASRRRNHIGGSTT